MTLIEILPFSLFYSGNILLIKIAGSRINKHLPEFKYTTYIKK